MTQEQKIHIGMINSYNLITNKNTLEEISSSDISIFAHVPDKDIPIELLHLMIDYFKSYEMFEHCIYLMEYIGINYNDDGTPINYDCECSMPIIKEYSHKTYCGACEKRLRI